MYLIPDLKKLKEDSIPWRVGFFRKRGEGLCWERRMCLDQASIPSDSNFLQAVDIQPTDYILFIAGGYGTWANALAINGVKVDYSEISQELIDFIKNRFAFNSYILSNYMDIPFQANIYDWTVSFEPMGSSQGLPISILRALRNRKGVKLFISPCNPESSKPKNFFTIAQTFSEIYNCSFDVKEPFIRSFTHCGEEIKNNHVVYTIYTNEKASQTSIYDIEMILRITENIHTEYSQANQKSLDRISRISALIDSDYLETFEFGFS